MVAGEYAVLDGAEALVLAVDARVKAVWSPRGSDHSAGQNGSSAGTSPLPPEALLARRRAEQSVGLVVDDLVLDTSALRLDGRKLGLGSSAAGAVAAAAAVYAWAGDEPELSNIRDRVFWDALRAHRSIAPNGSGADIAAAVYGGFVRITRRGDDIAVHRVAWPDNIAVRIAWTGRESRTNDLVSRVLTWAVGHRRAYDKIMDDIAAAAKAMRAAFENAYVADVLVAVERHHAAMARLGEATKAPLVESSLERIHAVATGVGGAAKPSGAGGGDVALCFFPDEGSASRFDELCQQEGFRILRSELAAPGVHSI